MEENLKYTTDCGHCPFCRCKIINEEMLNMEGITNLKITDVEVWNDKNKNIGLRLSWSANIGWGQYTIGFYDGKWYVDSEAMENPEDREFGRLVLNTWLDNLKDNPQYRFGNIF